MSDLEISLDALKQSIRDVPDFPKPGIVFKDITTLLKQGNLFKQAIAALAVPFRNKKVQKIAVIESRGFLLGAPLAYLFGVGVVPIRKEGKLPAETLKVSYALEYGTDTLTIHKDALEPGENVLLIDDLLATGGTARAALELIEKGRGKIAGIGFLVELAFLNGRQKLSNYDVFSLIKFVR